MNKLDENIKDWEARITDIVVEMTNFRNGKDLMVTVRAYPILEEFYKTVADMMSYRQSEVIESRIHKI